MSQKSGKKKAKRRYQQWISRSGVTRHNLITFGRLDDNSLPSDDSEDSTYQPMPTETSDDLGKKRKRRTLDHHNKQMKKKKKLSSVPEISQNVSPNWSKSIPNELLYKVFWHGVCTFGAVPFLCRCAQVCRKWNSLASYPCLWKCIDLSFMASFPQAKDETLNILSRNILSQVEQMSFCAWEKLTSAALEVIATSCSGLTSLNLARCKRVTARGLSSITANCPNLTTINLSSIKTDATSNSSIKLLLQHRGSQLKALYLAGNKSVGSPTLTAIQTFCGNLKILDLSDTSISNFHVERLQAGCPQIVELRLAQLSLLPSTPKRTEMESSAGFPDLELLSLASITGGNGTDDMLLRRLLKTSTKLRQIDLRGCEKITHEGLLNLPVLSLEQLFLSRCKISWKALFNAIGQKWKHSLKDLDVSWGNNVNDTALMCLASKKTPNAVLGFLNLAGSGVTATGVREVVDGCPNLKELNLTSCRGVPRGFKQLHNECSISRLRGQFHVHPAQIDLAEAEWNLGH